MESQLREQAIQIRNESKEKGQQATQAYNEDRKDQAHQLSVASKDLKAQADALDRQAAMQIFNEHNPTSNPNEIDLHGLYVHEATDFLANVRWPEARIIVGKGNPSKDGVAVVKPAVLQFCQEHNLRAEVDPQNSGVIIVYGMDRLPPIQGMSRPPAQRPQQPPPQGYTPQQYGGNAQSPYVGQPAKQEESCCTCCCVM